MTHELDHPSHLALLDSLSKDTHHVETPWSDEHIGKKLTVTECTWLYVYAILPYKHIYT